MSKEINNFDVLKEMSTRDLDIAAFPELMNFQRNKKGGLVTVGVAPGAFEHLINQAATDKVTHNAMLLVWSIEQFEQVKKELENG